MTDITAKLAEDAQFLVDRLTDFANDGDARTEDGESGWHGHVAPALSRFRTALTAYTASQSEPDDALEGLRELLDEHDKACGATKYTPSTQRPAAMHMYELQRQTFAAMYAYVRARLAQEPR